MNCFILIMRVYRSFHGKREGYITKEKLVRRDVTRYNREHMTKHYNCKEEKAGDSEGSWLTFCLMLVAMAMSASWSL